MNEDPNVKSLTGNQPAYSLSTTTVSFSTMNKLTPVVGEGKTGESDGDGDGDGDTLQKTSNELGRRQDGQPQQGGAGAGAGAGAGGEAGPGGDDQGKPEDD